MPRRRYIEYVTIVSGEISKSSKWTVELVSMLSRRFGIKKSSAYKILRRIYVENSSKIERHRIGKNDMNVHVNTLVWRGKSSLLKKYLGGQTTVIEYDERTRNHF